MAIIVDSHTHTLLCRHAVGYPVEYVENARRLGLKILAVTDHIPIATGYSSSVRMRPRELSEYRRIVREAVEAEKERKLSGDPAAVEVLYGVEADIVPDDPESNAAVRRVLKAEDFDIVLASLHPQVEEYLNWETKKGIADDDRRVREYFRVLAEAAQSGLFDVFAHCDVITLTMDRPLTDFSDYRESVMEFLEACRDSGCGMEFNTSGLLKPSIYRPFPHENILKWAVELGVRVAVGSDAHIPERVGFMFDLAEKTLAAAGLRETWVWRKRRAHPVGFC